MKTISFAVLALSLAACATETVDEPVVATDSSALGAYLCGAQNTADALSYYTQAVALAKLVRNNSGKECMRNPASPSASDPTLKNIANLMDRAIETCEQLQTTVWSQTAPTAGVAPVRRALAYSPISKLYDGAVNAEEFTAIEDMAGTVMYGPLASGTRQAAVKITFGSGGSAVVNTLTTVVNPRTKARTQTYVVSSASYSVASGEFATIDIEQNGVNTTYSIGKSGGEIVFVADSGRTLSSVNPAPEKCPATLR